jgi:general secretion pathway protein G
MKDRKRRAFTLIELMVVILILAILAALIIPRVFGKVDDAKRGQAITNMKEIEKALTDYRLDNDRYPESLDDLRQDVSGAKNWRGPYLEKDLPPDPWTNPYVYESDGKSYKIVSYGADGVEGGEGNDEDLVVTGGQTSE